MELTKLPQQWALWLSVEDDLRFLSHHDMMRMIERSIVRAAIPIRYSQGFNPHAKLSLACPRPVGVASMDDLLIMALEEADSPLDPQELLDQMNRACPVGMKCLRAENLSLRGIKALHPNRICFELPLLPGQAGGVQDKIEELAGQDSWVVQRKSKKGMARGSRRSDEAIAQPLDLKPMVADLHLDCDGKTPPTLRWTLLPQGESWARPGEVLKLLGLDERVDLARAVRTTIEYA